MNKQSKNYKQNQNKNKSLRQLKHQKNPKFRNSSNNKQVQMSSSEKPKGDYVKKFFERRLKIEMNVRNKIFMQAQIKNKGMGRESNDCYFGEQRNNEKDINDKFQQSGLCTSKMTNHYFGNTRGTNQIYSSIQFRSKQSIHGKKSINKSENNTNLPIRNFAQLSNSHPLGKSTFLKNSTNFEGNWLQWKQIMMNKTFGKERVDENLYLGSQTQKMRKDYQNMKEEYEYQFNPECKFFEMGKREKREETKEFCLQKSVDKDRNCKIGKTFLNSESNKRTERSNGFKYQINESLREKLFEILQNQRGIKNMKHPYHQSLLLSPQQNNSNHRQSVQNDDMEIRPNQLLREKVKKFTQNEPEMVDEQQWFLERQKNQKQNAIQLIHNTDLSMEQMIIKRLNEKGMYVHSDSSDESDEIKISNGVKEFKKQNSLVICAICQNNLEDQLWQYVQIFKAEDPSEEFQNDNSSETENNKNIKQNIQSERIPMLLQCGHSFHKVCVLQWLKYKPLCPLCKTVLREQDKDDEDISLQFANEENSNESYENSQDDEQQSEQDIFIEPLINFHSLNQFEPQILNRSMNMSLNTDSRVNIQISGNVTAFNSFCSSVDLTENQIDSHLEIEIENSSSSQSSLILISIGDSLHSHNNMSEFQNNERYL